MKYKYLLAIVLLLSVASFAVSAAESLNSNSDILTTPEPTTFDDGSETAPESTLFNNGGEGEQKTEEMKRIELKKQELKKEEMKKKEFNKEKSLEVNSQIDSDEPSETEAEITIEDEDKDDAISDKPVKLNFKVRGPRIFSPVYGDITNIEVAAVTKGNKVIYELELPDDMPMFKGSSTTRSILNLTTGDLVEFNLIGNKIIVNDGEVVDYRKIVGNKKVMPPVEIAVQSAVSNGEVYNLEVIPGLNSGVFSFDNNGVKAKVHIYSNFKVKNKHLYLLEGDKPYDLNVLPQEMHSAVSDLKLDEKDFEVKELSLKVRNEKAVYNLSVKESVKLFWIFPITVTSEYTIDPDTGEIELANKPWFVSGQKLKNIVTNVFGG